MNIEEDIKPLKILMSKYKQIDEMNNFDHELALVIDYTELSAIETLLTAYEKEKETNKQIKSKLDEKNIPIETLLAEFERLEDNTEEIEEKSNFENMGYEIAQAYFEFYRGIARALTEKRKESEDKQ